MTNSFRRLAALGGLALALAPSAPALAGAADGDLIIDRGRPGVRPAPAPRRRPQLKAKPPKAAGAETVQPFVLTRLEVTGSSLPAAAFDKAARPLIGKTFDQASIGKVLAAVQTAYADSPVALPLVTLTEAPGPDGIVRLHVSEGHIAGVALAGETNGDLDLVRYYAAKLTLERPLSRRTMERQLSLIGDIPGLTTTIALGPGATPDAVDMQLTLDQKRFETGLRIDSHGVSSLGRIQAQLTLTGYGLTRQGDRSELVLAAPSDGRRFFYVAASHQQPIGHDGASIVGSLGYLETHPNNGVDGEATTGALYVSWPALRGYKTNLVLTGGIDGIDSANAQLGEQIASEKVRTLRGSAGLQRLHDKSSGSVAVTLSAGIDGLGARSPVPGQADLDFLKLGLNADYVRDLTPNHWLSLGFTGQASGDRLPTSEQFVLGGSDYGRAYPSALVSGDSGVAVKAELGWRPGKLLPKPIDGSEVYGFVDHGWVWARDRPGFPGDDAELGSAGAGVRLNLGKNLTVEVEGARAVDDPRPGKDGWAANFGFTLRY
ncbi:MAG: ShlB/FhaC/HecB family hemolysin secretion/activation protein [Caulobacter sp.]|nr:ShlB/FhaC/HecB family hemolysin secretion/activation protein [Caulobacter sp.]